MSFFPSVLIIKHSPFFILRSSSSFLSSSLPSSLAFSFLSPLHLTLTRCLQTIRNNNRNLIDIPSTLQLERLQQQEAQLRSNEYISALNTVKLPQQAIKKLHSMTSVVKAGADLSSDQQLLEVAGVKSSVSSAANSVKAPSVREVLAEKTIDSKTLGWMANAMGELHQATEQIDVEDVGELIVTLSPPVRQ
ncbi:MAG: hypothetical protein JOS17DRAFT_737629 [Linnemannia elongata]|nr:MAG: hypothetical protein JOS17DRAFT_737629 [Linnemannia elongata]